VCPVQKEFFSNNKKTDMIAIVKYNAGNISSVKNAVNRLGFDCIITDDESEINAAQKVVFPGVGQAFKAMQYLQSRNLDRLIKSLTQPVLGICLGQQLMCRYSEEGSVDCMGIFDVDVKKFPSTQKVPHIGWNTIYGMKEELFEGLKSEEDVYYVHSYYCETGPDTIAETRYILPFSAAMKKDNFYTTQFHPEKSSDVGERILLNFLML
jgi:imidazole glycerol-phosphate synthase subunit HisH